MNKYSVMLSYPRDPFQPSKTYYQHVRALLPTQAVRIAQDMAVKANDGLYDHEDFEPLLVIEGRHDNIL